MVTSKLRQLALASVMVAAAAALIGATGATATPKAPKATGSTVTIAVTAPVNSAVLTHPGIFPAVEAAAKKINAEGGLGKGHHRLEVITCDNEVSLTVDTACANAAVSAHLIATVGDVDPFSAATYPIYEAAQISRIGILATSAADETSPDAFPITAGAVSALALGERVKDAGYKKVGSLAGSTPPELNIAAVAQRGANDVGLTYTGNTLLPATAITDYSPYAKQIATANAGADFVLVAPTQALPTMTAFANLAGHTQWVSGGSFGPGDLRSCGQLCNGMIGVELAPPVNVASEKAYPAIKQYLQEMGPDVKSAEVVSLNSWLATYALRELLAHTRGPITNKTVNAALANGTNLNVQGIVTWSPADSGPTEFPRITNCHVWFTKVVHEKEVLSQPTPVNICKAIHLN
jgi:ABC-type branched-subunit amino acid transport system substrate-binding protein